jgi:DNA invertase Pin-like site-specific DNA recombinase
MNNASFAYLRVSTDNQTDGDGFDRQAATIGVFARTNGLHLLGTFKDAVTGKTDGLNREGFVEMLETMEREHVKSFVVERLDRFARNLMTSECLFAECRKRGIAVYAADQPGLVDLASDGTDPTRVLIRQVMGAIAEWEKSVIVKKLNEARQRTGRKGGRQNFGEKPGEAHVLRIMVDLRRAGKSWGDIAKSLNETGVTTRNGEPWRRTVVAQIVSREIRNPVYTASLKVDTKTEIRNGLGDDGSAR